MRIVLSLMVAAFLLAAVPLVKADVFSLSYSNFGLLDDTYNNIGSPTTNYAGFEYLLAGAAGANNYSTLVKFNISNDALDGNIIVRDVSFYLYDYGNNFLSTQYPNMTVWGSQNQTWTEATMTYNEEINKIRNAANNFTFLLSNNSVRGGVGLATGWTRLNVTSWFLWAHSQSHSNMTLMVNQTVNQSGTDYFLKYSTYISERHGSVGERPTLNITYMKIFNGTENMLETKNFNFNLNISGVLSTDVLNVTLYVNGTAYVPTMASSGDYRNYTVVGVPPQLQGEINNSIYLTWWNISVNGENTSVSSNVAIDRLRILPCAAPMLNMTLNYSVINEDDLVTPIITNMGISFSLWIDSGNRTYSYSQSGNLNYSYCIYPGFASPYNTNVSLTYSNSSYSTRNYFTQASSYTNSTTNINLYLLALTNSTNILFTVYSSNKVPQPNVVIKVLRYYSSTGNFVEVATGKTGYDGTVMIPMELYQYYQYVMLVNGFTLSTTSSSQLSSITQSLYISPSNYIALFDYINGVSAGCSLDNSTKILSCTMNDQSGKLEYVTLTVNQYKAANYSVNVCSETSTASTSIVVCNLSLYNSSNLFYSYSGIFSGEPISSYTFSSGWISWAGSIMETGLMGVFLSMMLVITLFFAGMTNSPTTGIMLGSIGILTSSLSGLISIGWANMFPMLLVAAIIIYKLQD